MSINDLSFWLFHVKEMSTNSFVFCKLHIYFEMGSSNHELLFPSRHHILKNYREILIFEQNLTYRFVEVFQMQFGFVSSLPEVSILVCLSHGSEANFGYCFLETANESSNKSPIKKTFVENIWDILYWNINLIICSKRRYTSTSGMSVSTLH